MSLPLRRQKMSRARFVREGEVTSPVFELRRWLELSWIYPQSFNFLELQESKESYFAIGSESVFEITKYETLSAVETLKSLKRKIDTTKLFAPDLYIGVSALFWEDGELIWREKLPLSNFDRLPTNAWHYALERRRLDSSNNFLEKLNSNIREEELDSLTTFLLRLYKRAVANAKSVHFSTAEALVANLRERYQNIFRESFLIAVSEVHSTLLEVHSFFESYLVRHAELLFKRSAKNLWVDGHGAVSLAKIFIEKNEVENCHKTLIIDRADPARFSIDILADFAALAVDLEVNGFQNISTQLRLELQKAIPQVWDDEVFNFFKVVEGLRIGVELHLNSTPVNSRQNSLIQSRKKKVFSNYIGKSLILSLGVSSPICFFVFSADENILQSWPKTLSAAFSAKMYSSLSNSKNEHAGAIEYLSEIKKNLASAETVIFACRSSQSFEANLLSEYLRKHKIFTVALQAVANVRDVAHETQLDLASGINSYLEIAETATLQVEQDIDSADLVSRVLNFVRPLVSRSQTAQ